MTHEERIKRGVAVMHDMQRMGYTPEQILFMTKVSTEAANELRQLAGNMLKARSDLIDQFDTLESFQHLICGVAFLVLHNVKMSYDSDVS